MKKQTEQLLLTLEGKTINIGELHIALHSINTSKQHPYLYRGDVTLDSNAPPEALHCLLTEKVVAVNTYVFSAIDTLDIAINKYQLTLANNNTRVYNIYIEENNIEIECDFPIKKQVIE
ncbi:hypothetical protein LNQ81_06670 [Myroides sp. M-43]|uniref:hypothetical protein n=1 Tax=Myroides oncorhynchi TaxID=2893756 RepID=UPI001E5F8D8D|nr:hypothetical protein [Myroides oncorhynchi]MCC9042376.1 hypothetical protein [Myroides oncorhynchi]